MRMDENEEFYFLIPHKRQFLQHSLIFSYPQVPIKMFNQSLTSENMLGEDKIKVLLC